MHDIIIIGAGVIGGLIARELARYDVDVLILDKENDVANATTAANSAIIHSGYDPKPGSLKAKLNVMSVPMFKELCHELDVEFKRIGSLTVAQDVNDIAKLEALQERAKINGVEVKILTRDEVISLEPFINDNVVAGLFAPTAGIVNPFELTAHAIENAMENGVKLALNEEVVAITKEHDYFLIQTVKGEYRARVIINAAGVYADNITNMVSKAHYTITPRKGSYFVLDKMEVPLVNTVLFPLPNEYSKGILAVPTTAGNFLIGPTSEQIMSKEDVGTDYESLAKIKENALRLLKAIPFEKTIRTFSGLRATPSTGDFIIEHDKYVKGLINVAGIESPGLASSPAIALLVVNELVSDLLVLNKKQNFNPRVRPRVRSTNISSDELKALTVTNKDYGELICNCEHVTKAEIIDLLKRPIPIRSIKAVKKRLRAGFGMCQGSFCTPKVVEIIADFYKIPVSAIAYDQEDSYVVKTKK